MRYMYNRQITRIYDGKQIGRQKFEKLYRKIFDNYVYLKRSVPSICFFFIQISSIELFFCKLLFFIFHTEVGKCSKESLY